MADQYYFQASDGEKYGPVDLELLNQWSIDGRITNDSWVTNAETNKKVYVSDIEGFIKMPPKVEAKPPKPKHFGNIPNHLVKSVLSCFFCFPPLGLIAIIYACQVDGYVSRGEYSWACTASDRADKWANWSIGIGLVSILFGLYIGLNRR